METYDELLERQRDVYKIPGWMSEIKCSTCGGFVHPLKDDFLRSEEHAFCACDVFQNMRDLESFGYKPAPEARFAGGPYMMRCLDGTYVSEEDFGTEIERLLGE